MARKKKATTPLPKQHNPNNSSSKKNNLTKSATPYVIDEIEELEEQGSPAPEAPAAQVGNLGGAPSSDEGPNQSHDGGPAELPRSRNTVHEVCDENTHDWANLLRGSLSPKGMKLGYVSLNLREGVKRVKFQKIELSKESEKWNNAITFYVIGAKPSFTAVQSYFARNWNNIAKPDVFLHDHGYFIIRFKSHDDYCTVAYSGPHMFYGKATVIKPWSANFNFQEEMLRTVPIWVRFPNLPLNCWSQDSLSRLGSAIGDPLYADECTTKQLRISFARLLIEVDVTKPLMRSIPIEQDDDTIVEQKVLYEWIPPFCAKCNKVGHNCANKKTAPKRRNGRQKQQWVPKPTRQQPAEAANRQQVAPPTKAPAAADAQGETHPATAVAHALVEQQPAQQQPAAATQQQTAEAESPCSPCTPYTVTTQEEAGWKIVTHRARDKRKQPTPLQIQSAPLALELEEAATWMEDNGDVVVARRPP